MNLRPLLVILTLGLAPALACDLHAETAGRYPKGVPSTAPSTVATTQEAPMDRVVKSEDQWKKELPADVCSVLREGATERPFRNAFWDNHAAGTYSCAGCGLVLFRSDEKFDSGTGWPSFWQPAKANTIEEVVDRAHGMVRTEVRCARCAGHLGHVFDDGPKPTGQRYCINSAALKFTPAEPAKK